LESGLPRFPPDYTCPVVLRMPLRVRSAFGYCSHISLASAFQRIQPSRRIGNSTHAVLQPPKCKHLGLGFSDSLAAYFRNLCDLFSSSTEMVHFPGLAHTRLFYSAAVARVHLAGFPHSDILGSKPACGPRAFAAATSFIASGAKAFTVRP